MGLQLKLNISNFSDEFCGGGSSVVALSSPSFSLLGGKKPGCYIGVAFSDGSVQLLLRDGLAQIASVELPRGGNIAWAKATLQRILYSNIYVYPLFPSPKTTDLVIIFYLRLRASTVDRFGLS